MPNRLAQENSPYLIQHAANPVDWYAWGPQALALAAAEDKPIFLSIGYAACHWCHVMAHESFEDPATAAIMNREFINIKVDREERPDLDGIYMNAVVAMTGSGGWPMSVFLTPEGVPFYGGTYFPPVNRYNMPAFSEILQAIARLWKEDRAELLGSAQRLVEHLQSLSKTTASPAGLRPDGFETALESLSKSYDWQFGGWGQAPKFPQPMAIEVLLRHASRGDAHALKIARHALESMARGGMYDVVGGGFARYSTDNHWFVPHFEKMLYDNAQLAQVYLYAYLLSGDESFRRVCESSLDFLLRELSVHITEDGVEQIGFYSSLDADSEGAEGKFYLWEHTEIQAALQDSGDAQFFMAAYGVTPAGNFEGKNILQRLTGDEDLSSRFAIPVTEIPARLQACCQLLLAVRAQRIRPATDDKVLVSWNALALIAFAEAGRYLHRPDYLAVARANAEFLLHQMNSDGQLLRSWRAGQARHSAYLEDYAGLTVSLLYLYQADAGQTRWFEQAQRWMGEIITHMSDPEWGFFDTRDDHEKLLLRPKELQDNATPTGGSLAAQALLYLSALDDNGSLRERAEQMLASIQDMAVRYPTAFSKWLCAIDLAAFPGHQVAILGDPSQPATQRLIEQLFTHFMPNTLLAVSNHPVAQSAPSLLHNRICIDNQPTAYVCHNFVCLQPVTDPHALQAQLNSTLK